MNVMLHEFEYGLCLLTLRFHCSQDRYIESLVSAFVHLGLDGIWRTQTYRDANEGNVAKNYQKVMWETRVTI